MNIFKIVAIGLTAACMASLLRRWRSETAILVSVAAAAVIFIAVLPYLKSVLSMLRDISGKMGVDADCVAILLRVIGIAYCAALGAELCRDAGEGAIASKIELAGKIIIMALSMPVMYRLLGVIEKIVNL